MHLLGVDLGGELREAGEVGEQDRDRPALAGRLAPRDCATRAPHCGQKRAAAGSGAPQSTQAGQRVAHRRRIVHRRGPGELSGLRR